MTDSRSEYYFLEKDFNCAEASLKVLNEKYGLGLKDEDFKLVGACGGGYGCGLVCGALAGSMAALGKLVIGERAHATEGFKELCAEYVEAFRGRFGDTDCAKVKPAYFEEGRRCVRVVEGAVEVFDEFVASHRLV